MPESIAAHNENTTSLIAEIQRLEQRATSERQFGDPIQAMCAQIADMLGEKTLSPADLEHIVRELRDRKLRDRALHLRRYLALDDDISPREKLEAAARTVVERQPDVVSLAQALSKPQFAAVFTAHPTFALADRVYRLLEEIADDPQKPIPSRATHRRSGPPTLAHEQTLALAAILRGRDALDIYTTAILRHATNRWPDTLLSPSPIVLSTWVGFDTDGRSDITWWDTLRIRLSLKRLQFERLHTQLSPILRPDSSLLTRLTRAIEAVSRQEDACPDQHHHDISRVVAFAKAMIADRTAAISDATELLPLFEEAIAETDHAQRIDLLTARAGFLAHGLSVAHVHTRLNAVQIYNVARQRLGIEDDPAIPSRRRVVLSQINEALDNLTPVAVDFGALMIEQSSAARLMMTMAQMVKHIDAGTPVRFLIAETESGFTLLATLWLARLLGIEDRQIQISPLFETQSALEHGETILEEAFRSEHWRQYLRANGKLCLQFGYSDSGRYIGQLAATNLVERLRLRTLSLLKRHKMQDIEVILFDTHGESIGRGAHPFSLAKRMNYFSPEHTSAQFAAAGVHVREETAFQGGDGYTLFGTPNLALATIATIAEHTQRDLDASEPDPIYDQPDFSSDFFSTIALSMSALVADPGYAGLLGAFGPALIDKSGSRPSARQGDGVTVVRITHPNQLRAIPNNAILQQLGWWANVLQGLGDAATRHAEDFDFYAARSKRFGLAMDFARQALAHSDLDVLHSTVRLLDPGTWLDRAAASSDDETRRRFMDLSNGLEGLEFWVSLPAMFRRIQADHLMLRMVWRDAPQMQSDERLLHAIRIAIIERIWLLSTRIPYFSPRNNVSREALTTMILRLEIENALSHLKTIFPLGGDAIDDLDFFEPTGPREDHGFRREHEEVFEPMARLFALLREVGVAIMHANGAFG
ncbi:phosphoenolpyruvate carboxylase [Neoasaia chiangmaiensis NBRC 101099]|uniref:Phosphoenolpyruvate carboxylase n=2 Tax=Neoasaia chiangmaiensis TaxID=320497 RepID=A0A1U9KMT3_9PROT|nr:phosphoenolpyruvate carboxylase [Neoasaia chiangmaiensis]AQS87085.1 phosphoenolpyruvate carboxylase [Neoasaia chiangmaiensis]GBR38014.1 phosphoenolpyruvate carboxylase [Neoasaia chiangmaiensis NBRC 101099]GEN15231.1 phosphoenolpyruvate carboxylase [Neoasaia chiangmaiensis]